MMAKFIIIIKVIMKEPNLQRISKALENYCHWIVKQNLLKQQKRRYSGKMTTAMNLD